MPPMAGGTPRRKASVPNLFGTWKSNVNKLIPMYKVGKLGYGAPYKNVLCKVYKVDGYEAGRLRPDGLRAAREPRPGEHDGRRAANRAATKPSMQASRTEVPQ